MAENGRKMKGKYSADTYKMGIFHFYKIMKLCFFQEKKYLTRTLGELSQIKKSKCFVLWSCRNLYIAWNCECIYDTKVEVTLSRRAREEKGYGRTIFNHNIWFFEKSLRYPILCIPNAFF